MNRLGALLCVVLMGVAGCGETGSESDARSSASRKVSFDRALHDELMTMLEEDQAGRMKGEMDATGDQERTERLKDHC